MSFLNPINLTPKIYQSTDPQAPQLLGQVGDVKSIVKACLVTGYGEKDGAGFTLKNESDKACEFVSPNVAMSIIGVDEDSNSYIFYFYDGTTKKSPNWMNGLMTKSKTKNASWTMLVCELGLFFVMTTTAGVSQVIYQGLIKSAINDNNKNMLQLSAGNFNYNNNMNPLIRLGAYTDAVILSNAYDLGRSVKKDYLISLVSDIFWRKEGVLLGQQPALLLKNVVELTKETIITTYQDRPVLSCFLATGTNDNEYKSYGAGAMIFLDRWEY